MMIHLSSATIIRNRIQLSELSKNFVEQMWLLNRLNFH